jgi:methyl-accepting chemotaxis protein
MKQEIQDLEDAPSMSANWMPFFYAGLIILVCVAFYQGAQTQNLLRLVVSAQKDNAALRKNLSRSEQEFRESLVRFHTELAGLQEQLATTRQQADSSLEAAKAATVYADALGGKLDRKRRDQEKRQQQLSAQLSKVEKSTDETSERLNGISNEVGGVRDTLASVRADATRNIDELQHARGDVSELQNGVATNSKQIQNLRELGGKQIVEFNLTKSAGLQRVGDIKVKLNRTDEKRNTFTLEIAADDKVVEKRDRTINEPVEFFVSSKPSQPYELVVNEVGKNTVKGYLATPKETYVRD